MVASSAKSLPPCPTPLLNALNHGMPAILTTTVTAGSAAAAGGGNRDAPDSPMIVGVVDNAIGVLRPEASESVRGSELIIHAGDIGDPAILDRLSEIAPVTAVRANNDKVRWAARLPQTDLVQVGATFIYIIHDLAD